MIVRHLPALVLIALFAAVPAAALEGVPLSDARAGADRPEEGSSVHETDRPQAAEELAEPEPARDGVPSPDGEAAATPRATGAHEELTDWEDPEWLFEEEYEDPANSDPLEPGNRAMFGLNEFVYRWVMNPVTDVYSFVVPRPVRRSVIRFFDNLGEPANLVNELLQLNPRRAGKTSARFLMNSTVGVVGLFDPASGWGFESNRTGFGETLGAYGVGSGWYLVVPVLGPSTVRDLFGDAVDSMLRPHVYLMGTYSVLLVATGGGLSRYDHNRAQLDVLRTSSVDFYAAMRSAYLLQRRSDVREARAASPVLRDDAADVDD
ncbi:MAG: VacJ family lipoprotein, partial [Myxococcales bacterium]|nr:VacJ family lipoprotein [Myxococcales bacterium]